MADQLPESAEVFREGSRRFDKADRRLSLAEAFILGVLAGTVMTALLQVILP